MKLPKQTYIYILLTLISSCLFYYAIFIYGGNNIFSKNAFISLSIAIQASAIALFNLEKERLDHEYCYGKCLIFLVVVSVPNLVSVMLSMPGLLLFAELYDRRTKKLHNIPNHRTLVFISLTTVIFIIYFLFLWFLY